MRPEFLLPETTVRDAGSSPAIELREERGGTLFLTLGITRIVEKESIEIGIWGSSDGTDWGTVPLAAFPRKSYCGTYQMELDLSRRPDVKYIRAKWELGRWSRVAGKPLFTVYLFAHAPERELACAGA